jgi:hypothetical protein
MPVTVPNQRTVKIHRVKPKSDFLGIKNEVWQKAARDLGAHGLMLYLYLASNADNYSLALSPVAISQAIGMPASTYRDQFKKLVDKKYLVQRGEGNTYDFYEVAQRDTHSTEDSTGCNISETADALPRAGDVDKGTSENREINSINNSKYSIDNIGGAEKQVSPPPHEQEFRF